MSELRIVTTPIGNLEDITARAINTLKESSYILAEDTRVTKRLLGDLGITFTDKKIVAFHDHNKSLVDKIITEAKSYNFITLVSDAGSPIISDPAYPLVKAFIDNNLKVDTVPGVNSVVTALELSGLPAHPYKFHGFLGRKKGEIISKLKQCENEGATHIFFESPHRILETLNLISEDFPNCEIAVCRELTKEYQSVYRFKASELNDQDIVVKGEFVVVIYFDGVSRSSSSDLKPLALKYLAKKTPKNLAKILSPILGVSVNEAYEMLNS